MNFDGQVIFAGQRNGSIWRRTGGKTAMSWAQLRTDVKDWASIAVSGTGGKVSL